MQSIQAYATGPQVPPGRTTPHSYATAKDSYVLLADDHVNNVSYFPFMSIKKVIPYFCVLGEGYYVIIWLIVRICVFIKD
jgi:hypothetical protein